MQLPGLDELEGSIERAVEELGRRRSENTQLTERMRSLGKELSDLADQVKAIGSDQKVDSKRMKKIEQRLRSIAGRLG